MVLLVRNDSSYAPVSTPGSKHVSAHVSAPADTVCSGCGSGLVAHDVVHFERGRRHTTVELLCVSTGCEHHTRPARPTAR